MTIEEDIAFWRKIAAEAESSKLSLLAIGITIGLTLARNEHAIGQLQTGKVPIGT